jgi:hypothetical protein
MTRLEMVEKGGTVAAKNACRQIRELKNVIKEMRERREYPEHVKEVEALGLLEIKKDLLEATKKEQERIGNRLIQIEKEYIKQVKENPIDINSVIARYHGMTDKELNNESMKMILNPRGNNPVIADYLSAELRARNLPNHSILREKLNEVGYTTPWLHSDEGQALQNEARFYEHSKPGDFLFMATNQVGKLSQAAANINQVYDEL